MLTQFILNVRVVVRHHEPTTTQLDPINNVTARRTFVYRLGSHHPYARPQPRVTAWAIMKSGRSSARIAHCQPPLVGLLKDIERCIVGTFDNAITPVITSLAVMDERLSQIESKQQTVEQALRTIGKTFLRA